MSERPPYVCEPTDQRAGRPAVFIFLHGYGDDAEGLPLGMVQQFQFHSKMPYLRWVLPNAPHNQDAMTRAWYQPKSLDNSLKPRVPDQLDDDDEFLPDDEEGILKSVDVLDKLVEAEIVKGIDPKRIIVGGFSQGCAVSLIWGVIGQYKDKVAGVACLSGYFPLANRIASLRKERNLDEEEESKKWFYIHGTKDMLVPTRLFVHGNQELVKWIHKDSIDGHLYDGMGHTISAPVLRDLLIWLENIIPP